MTVLFFSADACHTYIDLGWVKWHVCTFSRMTSRRCNFRWGTSWQLPPLPFYVFVFIYLILPAASGLQGRSGYIVFVLIHVTSLDMTCFYADWELESCRLVYEATSPFSDVRSHLKSNRFCTVTRAEIFALMTAWASGTLSREGVSFLRHFLLCSDRIYWKQNHWTAAAESSVVCGIASRRPGMHRPAD